MSTNTLGLFLRHLALSEEVSRLGTASDLDLLAAYEAERGQAAFTELMRRHGPMVLRTCRRVLGHGPDAEDAFQATFVLLAGKANQLRREATGPLSLGGWLHRVAYRTALDVLAKLTRRRVRERQVGPMNHADFDPVAEATWNEVRPILDAELDALPDEARRLLIACYLQEKSHAEAAMELGLPLGSLARRLDKARALLAERLARRGITVSASLLVVLLGEAAWGAGVPAVLLVHSVEAAKAFTEQATGALSDSIAQLVKGGLAKMTNGSTHLSVALAGWLGLLGAGLLACQTLKAWPDQPAPSEPPATAEASVREGNKAARTDRHGDPLPAGALARLGTTRMRHTGLATQVLFAPDGQTVASAGLDGIVRLWDAATGKLVQSLNHPPQKSRTRLISFAPDGKTLLSVAHNHLWQWEVRTGKQLRKLKLVRQPNQRTDLVAVSSDGKTAASEGADAVIQLWDVASGNPLRVLQGHQKSISVLSFSPDNKTLASVTEGDNKVVRLWDVASGKLLHELAHPLAVQTLSFSPDGKTLASGGSDKTKQGWFVPEGNPSAVRLWDVTAGKLLHTLEGHQHTITSLSFSRDGKVLASGSHDKTVRLWDVTAGKKLRKLKCPCVTVLSLSFAPDGKVLAVGSGGPAVHLWDVTTGAELHRPEGAHTTWVRSASFAPDGRTLATAAAWGGEDRVRLWDAVSGEPLRNLEHLAGAQSVTFAPDGKTLASGGEGVVRIWDAATGKQLRNLDSPGGAPLAFSADGKTLAAGSNGEYPHGALEVNGTLRLWDVATGTQLRLLEHHRPTTSVAFSPDGKTLVVGTDRGILHLWDPATGKELLKLDKSKEHWGLIAALSFAPDGKTLAVGNNNSTIHLLEVSSGKELRALTGHSGSVLSVAFSPSGRLLASGSIDQTVRLWEVHAGLASPCHQFRGHDAWVEAVAFSPDGRRLVSGSRDSTALVWDVTGQAGGQTRTPRLTNEELTACWQSLANTDTARAYQSLRTLAAAPHQAVPFLAEHLVVKKTAPQQVARLLADLDSDDFRVRSQAAKELEKLGEAVEPALRRALKDNPSVEVRRHIQRRLEELNPKGVSPQLLRWLRALEVLEWIDTPAARKLLEKLAAAPPWEEVGREAQAALRRLRVFANR